MKKRTKRKKTGISLAVASTAIALGLVTLAPLSAEQGAADNASPTSTTRTIQGRVLNSTGAVVEGAIVLLKDNKTLQVRSYIAQNDGSYHFFGLSTEVNYTVRAEHDDMTSKQKTVSVFDSHRQVKLDLKLTQKAEKTKK